MLADRGLGGGAAVARQRDAAARRSVRRRRPRPAAAVETAAYFVVAEALANAAKHAGAGRVDIRIVRGGGLLTLDVTDDGGGGADPEGDGLQGLRRRVEALDGRLVITSPTGGPTTIHAELPCA